ncbi:ABC transporter substrate-binding protein [Nonomuraea fuscirosea]|uniref:ABC transporter substrate-binding protein n=1 Tax=Nonomuraea fuscirosea TaxID=1291556 RepID=UPI0033F204F5
MKRKHPVALTIVAVSVLLGGCGGGGGGSPTGAPVTGGTFTMNLGTDPGTINPYKTTGGTNRQIFAFSYDTLVGRMPDGSVAPQLATEWKVAPDEVTYTLRKGVTCEDGTPLTASAVAADFDYVKDPKTLSAWVSLTIPVPYTVTADDAAGTVTVKTKTPFGFLLEGAGSLPIVCPAGLKDPGSIEHASNGTGPYKVTDYVPGDHYTLEARPGYAWGPKGAGNAAAGSPKTVKIAFVQNESTSANQLLSGQVNAAQITGPDRARLDATPTLKKFDVPVMVGEMNLNEAKGRVFADPEVRLAMAAALDRAQVTKVGTSGNGQVADNMMVEKPVSCPGDETTGTLPAFDPAAANQRLDAAGYAKGADGVRAKDGKKLTVNLIYQVGAPQTVSAVELIGQQLMAVGIGTNLKGLTQAAFLEALYTTQDFDAYYSGINLEFPFMMTAYWGGATPDKGGRNTGSIRNEEFDTLSAKALAASGSEGCELWKQAHQALLKRVDVLPISVGNRPFYTAKASLQTVGLFAVPTSLRLYQ